MTTNHPANGPVSLDRLHQISGILSKAAAQSDGGNLGYAMVDAVKVIDSAIAAFDAEPVAWTEKCEITNMQATGLYLRGFPDNSQGRDVALYTAQPAPVVPDEKPMPEASKMHAIDAVAAIAKVRGWNACRDAMLQAGSSPVTPDGYVLVPKEMTPEMMRAVQIKSELGGYAASELSGAYDMFRDFWDVAVSESQQKQSDSTSEEIRLLQSEVTIWKDRWEGLRVLFTEIADALGCDVKNNEAMLAEIQRLQQLGDELASAPKSSVALILVSERLPEIRKGFLDVAVLIAHDGEAECSEALYCSDGNFRWGRDEDPIENVTHWMPLPAAPQQEVK